MALLTWAIVLLAGFTCTQGLGTETSIEDYPSIVQIEYKVATAWLQQALGSIITNFHVLTAAQSCQANPINRRLGFGSSVRGISETYRDPILITSHPSYNAQTGNSDICIMRLNATILFGPTIYPVLILPQDFFIPENIPMTTAGYGVTTEGGQIGNNRLHELAIITKNLAACSSSHPGRVTSNNICVGLSSAAGRDLDNRDIGGAVYYENILSGIISFGAIRRNDEVPIVTQSTGAFSNWIVSNAN